MLLATFAALIPIQQCCLCYGGVGLVTMEFWYWFPFISAVKAFFDIESFLCIRAKAFRFFSINIL